MGKFLMAAVVAGCTALGASAQTAKEGRFDYTACWSGVGNYLVFSKTHIAYTYEMSGSTRSNIPDNIYDKNTFRCVGMNTSFDGKSTGNVVCEAVDRDGDRRLSTFSIGVDGQVARESVAGYGKYDGMRSTTTVEPLGPFPTVKEGTFQDCNHQTGTYKLK